MHSPPVHLTSRSQAQGDGQRASASSCHAALACRSAASHFVAAATFAECPSPNSSPPRAWFWAACWLLMRSGGRGLEIWNVSVLLCAGKDRNRWTGRTGHTVIGDRVHARHDGWLLLLCLWRVCGFVPGPNRGKAVGSIWVSADGEYSSRSQFVTAVQRLRRGYVGRVGIAGQMVAERQMELHRNARYLRSGFLRGGVQKDP